MPQIALAQGRPTLVERIDSPLPQAALSIHERPLRYVERLDRRSLSQIDLLIVHATELPTLEMARNFGEKIRYASSGSGNSGHFYIDRDGAIEQFVPLERVAHHIRGYNGRSVGVELVNTGRYPHWYRLDHQRITEPYPNAQIEALVNLCNQLSLQIPTLSWIAGHDELDISEVAAEDSPETLIRRKVDPGAHFPWSQVLGSSKLKRLLLG